MLGPKNNEFIKTSSNNLQIKTKVNELKIALVCQGNLIGTEDAINQRNYSTTVKCSSLTGSLFTLKIEDFNHWVGKNEKTMRMIREMSLEKDKNTKRKIKQMTNI